MPVRRATTDDVESILPMVGSICAYHTGLDPARYDFLPDVVERYARWLPARATDPRSLLLVAEDLRPVGFLVATIEANIPVYRTGEFAYIHDVWVEREHRGRGHASGMVCEAVKWFRQSGVAQIRLETAAKNEAARRVFASCGFRVASMEMICTL